MDFIKLREALRQARHQAPVERKGVHRVGMTLKEAAATTGLNLGTIHSIENVRREPTLKPELETIERLAMAYGLTLSAFFARMAGELEAARNVDDLPAVEHDDEADHTQYGSEDQIAARVIRLLTRLALKGSEAERAEDHRLHPKNRPNPPARRPPARKSRRRALPKPKDDQPPKE